MCADDKGDHGKDVLLCVATLEQDDSEDDRNDFQRHKNPVDFSVESTTASSELNLCCREANVSRFLIIVDMSCRPHLALEAPER